MKQTKSYKISKTLIYEAYKQVKANKGCHGVDEQSIKDFEQNLKNNLYKLWNRMSSGSYFPQAVRRVEIPKADGGMRPLGIPTVTDRIAQTAVKIQIEPELERIFHPDSYGYRPGKSAHQAIRQVRARCWQRPWVLDMDIKGFFDTIPQDLLMLAVEKHVKEPWQRLYVERWLQTPVQYPDGHIEQRTKGTPQGGVISPLLANLFLHYCFDMWIGKSWKSIQFERYADDIICHCLTERQAKDLKGVITKRFKECGLQLHPEKTKIVYCKSWQYKADHDSICFDFLGFTFRPRMGKAKEGKWLLGFVPAISRKAAKRIRTTINEWPWLKWVQGNIWYIIKYAQSKIRGWLNYYGISGCGIVKHVLSHFDQRLSYWMKRKYKKVRTWGQAAKRLYAFREKNRPLLVHWN